MTVELLTEHHLEFLSFKGGYKGSSESTLVKMPQCSKSHVTAHYGLFILKRPYILCESSDDQSRLHGYAD